MRPGEKKFTTMMELDPVNQMGEEVDAVECPGQEYRPNIWSAVCTHKFVHFDTTYKTSKEGYHSYYWKRIDRFYCERCLELKDVVREQISEYSPDWWKEK
jgi:hypothetical protein